MPLAADAEAPPLRYDMFVIMLRTRAEKRVAAAFHTLSAAFS